ncbi:MAG: DUF975 family protein [Oscillospiraceae bacterium]|nr:DUF975 family protein [Oscillospiraceae bacterium]
MFDRKELKANAKKVFKKYGFWTPFAVTFVTGLVSAGFGGSSVSTSGGDIFEALNTAAQDPSATAGAVFGAFLFILLGIAIGIVVNAFWASFVAGPFLVGSNKFFMENRLGGSKFSNIVWAFKEGRYLPVVKTLFIYNIKIALWSLLFCIPGLIKALEFTMVPYILAENPTIDKARAFEISKATTNGEKWNIFVFILSFLGWVLLGMVTCGIALLYLEPFMAASYAELYQKLREKALDNGYAEASELPGFEA